MSKIYTFEAIASGPPTQGPGTRIMIEVRRKSPGLAQDVLNNQIMNNPEWEGYVYTIWPEPVEIV